MKRLTLHIHFPLLRGYEFLYWNEYVKGVERRKEGGGWWRRSIRFTALKGTTLRLVITALNKLEGIMNCCGLDPGAANMVMVLFTSHCMTSMNGYSSGQRIWIGVALTLFLFLSTTPNFGFFGVALGNLCVTLGNLVVALRELGRHKLINTAQRTRESS